MISADRFVALCRELGTDKSKYAHAYAQVLPALSVGRVLELGVDEGASLRLWRALFPGAAIFAIDSNPAVVRRMRPDDRFTVSIGRQEHVPFLHEVARDGPFDLVVDDAGHDPRAQSISFFNLFRYLSPGGLYVIEDVPAGNPLLLTPDIVECSESRQELIYIFRKER